MPERERKKIVIEVGDGAAIPSKKDPGLVNAWGVSFIGAIAILAYLCWSKPDVYLKVLLFMLPDVTLNEIGTAFARLFGHFEFAPLWEVIKVIANSDGVIVTFKVTVFSIALALVLGLITGLGRISKNRFINLIASTYVEVVRGIPLLVQLFYIYFALGQIFRNLPETNALFVFLKNMPPLVAAVSAMGICYGAYMGEVFRAGIESIDKGQDEAARSLGFNRRQTMFLVILPQAWRTILPPVGNEFIALLKDSSLVSILAVADILRRGREYASVSFSYFEAYTVVALVYLIITLILSRAVSRMEQRLSYYEQD